MISLRNYNVHVKNHFYLLGIWLNLSKIRLKYVIFNNKCNNTLLLNKMLQLKIKPKNTGKKSVALKYKHKYNIYIVKY